LTINNWGRITSNGGDYSVYNDASNFTLNNYSGGTITSGYDTVYSDGANTTINNWGTVSCAGDYALDIEAANTTINNYQGGVISAAYDPIYVDGSNTTINNWGAVTSSGEYGIYSDSDYFTMNNWGTVTSLSSQALYNDGNYFALNNWGTLSSGGDGVDDYASNGVLKNWGMISGAGLGIYIDGNNNTLDLNGHSSVIGKISVLGTTNVVNLNFTGLSPATIAVLTAQLVPQGVNSGNPTSATFSLRGVNYNIDPAIIYFHPSSYQLQAKTPNQAVIGRNLDSLTANPAPGTPFFNLLNAIDASGNVPGALDAISPLKYAVYGDLAIQNTTSIVQDVDRRLNNLRDGSESVDTTGAGGDTVAAVVTGDPSKDGSKESKQVVQPEAQENRWGFFASGDGLFYRGGSSNSSLENGKSNSAGTLAGVDGKVGENAVIGTFFAYNNSAVDLGNDGSHATIESYSGGLYGAYHQDGFYANSLAAYTRNNYTSSSNVLFPGFATTGNGSTHGNQYSANIDGGYDFHLGERLTVGPIGGLQYVHLDVNGFNESGGILALGDQSMNSLQSRLGAKAEYKIATTATSSFGAETYVAWQHEYLDNSRGIGASFEGSGLAPFVVQTGSPDRDAAVVGAALNFTFHKRLTLFADYELQMWNASYFEQSVNGGAKISF
jgi:outer membrane autotransporter protein